MNPREQDCPIPTCPGELFLDTETCAPLLKDSPDLDVLTSAWVVQCTEGHIVWTHVDQIRTDSAAGLFHGDEAGDYAPTFRLEAVWW